MPTTFAGLDRQVAGVGREAPIAAATGVRAKAHAALREMSIIAPRDTARYVRAWAQCNNFIKGVPKLPVLPVKESRYLATMEARLSKQVHRLERYVFQAREREKYWRDIFRARYETTGRKGKWRADCARKVKKAEKTAAKMETLLKRAQDEAALLDAGGKFGAIVIGGRKTKKFGASNLSTVRGVVYGGAMDETVVNGRVFITATNREPHASIVESRSHVVARANAAAKTIGTFRAGAEIAKRIKAAAR